MHTMDKESFQLLKAVTGQEAIAAMDRLAALAQDRR
jgi:hypothetical protein